MILRALLPVVCASCVEALSPDGARVVVSDENMVRECHYVTDITGSDETIDTARNNARNRAANMGATNIVFVSAESKGQWHMAHAMGHLYRCDD